MTLHYEIAMTMEEASDVFSKLRAQINATPSDEDLNELYQEFLSSCISYANIRAEWSVMTREKKLDSDSHRTSLHNGVIRTLTILKRYMNLSHMDVSWCKNIAPEDADMSVQPYRKRVGDFACHIADILAIESR